MPIPLSYPIPSAIYLPLRLPSHHTLWRRMRWKGRSDVRDTRQALECPEFSESSLDESGPLKKEVLGRTNRLLSLIRHRP
jgi:hypothetical protein